MRIIPRYKPSGVQNTEILNEVRKQFPDTAVMHAGALDPLAEGLLLVVVGTEKHTDILPLIATKKTYEFEILLGFRTDTWDILGIPISIALPGVVDVCSKINMQELLSSYKGEIIQKVPHFSNMRYRGKRMYEWAREGRVHEVPSVFRKRIVHDISFCGIRKIPATLLFKEICEKLVKVQGDYRQEEILGSWQDLFNALDRDEQYAIVSGRMVCDSGTYVRSLAYDLGEQLGVGATVWRICRTHIGTYTLDDVEKMLE